MQYFFILGNVASIAALAGFLLQVNGYTDIGDTTFLIFVGLTVVFWLWFYLSPANAVRTRIEDKLNYSGTYQDSSDRRVEIAEGEFEISDFGNYTVSIPPLEKIETVTLYPIKGGRRTPSVRNKTTDSFDVSPVSSREFGRWRYRVRGTQLRKQDK